MVTQIPSIGASLIFSHARYTRMAVCSMLPLPRQSTLGPQCQALGLAVLLSRKPLLINMNNKAATGLWFDFAHHPELGEGRPWYPPLLRRNSPKHHPALPLRVIHCSHSSTALPPWHLAKANKNLCAKIRRGFFYGRGGRNRTHVIGFGDQGPTTERHPHVSRG